MVALCNRETIYIFIYIFALNVNTVKMLNFTKLRPICTTVHIRFVHVQVVRIGL